MALVTSSNRSHYREQQLRAIEKHEAEIRKAATDRGLTMAINGDGTHWDFRRTGKIIDWWPGSGKVAVDKRFDERLRADNVGEIMAILEANKGAVKAPEPVAAARPLTSLPAVAAVLDAFDFDALALEFRRHGWTYGEGMRRHHPGAAELRRTADLLLTGCRPDAWVTSGRLLAERVGVEYRLAVIGEQGLLALRCQAAVRGVVR